MATAATVIAMPTAAQAADSVAAAAPADVIRSGVPWYDNNGQMVNAHGAGMIKVGSTYYMIGEKRSTTHYEHSAGEFQTKFIGFQCYSSQDLMNWTDQGTALGIGAPGTPIDGTTGNERPKILYNAATSTYVMFFHQYGDHTFGYATSSSPCSGYTYRGWLLNASGAKVPTGDTGAFVDTDGKGYVLTTNGTIHALSNDYQSVTNTVVTGAFSAPYESAESPALFKSGDTYFLLGSSLWWWRSNPNFYATATSLAGPWTTRGVFAKESTQTYNSQTTFVLPVTGSAGTTYMYMGDRWCNNCLPSSTYVWQPLTVSGTTLSLPAYRPQWSIDVNQGTWAEVTDAGTTVNDATVGTGTNQFDYGAGWATAGCVGAPSWWPVPDVCHNGDNTYSKTTGAVAHLKFTGTQVKLYSVVDNKHGQVAASICDADRANCGPETLVDLYSPYRVANTMVWASPAKASGTYTLKLRVAGTKSAYSSDSFATVDRVTVTTGSTPDPGTGTVVQAEDADRSGGAVFGNEHDNYTGSGFVATYGSTGSTTTFTVNAASAGSRAVTLRYANGGWPTVSTKKLSLYVNGNKQKQIDLPPTDNWSTWADQTETVPLTAGTNTITYKIDPGDTGYVNLDSITVTAG